ncbi:hypothetical protein MB46_08400 [Arthrobacter alpinus]|uniref:universal stress protein n=1 Tax=Arthrobacter alpinus TaxID=656366 RepID=UPI0005CA21EF|nr:universal stress protein [Arthrobacter alpinus]ALV45509.1 hypothetical protein MB46_08400 [Arthrobacter alpinus]
MPQPSPNQTCVLAGVHLGQPAGVVLEAARLAAALNCPLICAYSNPARFPVEEKADGSVTSESVDPDFMDASEASFPAELAAELQLRLGSSPVQWRTALLAGDPARALARCAQITGATMIVVGTHGDARTPLRDILRLSVAAHLTRLGSCPVLVVPTFAGTVAKDRL